MLTDFATVEAVRRSVGSGFEVPGEVIHVPDGLVEVTAPVEGILRFSLNRDALRRGPGSPPDSPWWSFHLYKGRMRSLSYALAPIA